MKCLMHNREPCLECDARQQKLAQAMNAEKSVGPIVALLMLFALSFALMVCVGVVGYVYWRCFHAGWSLAAAVLGGA